MLPDDDKQYAIETCRSSESVLKWFKNKLHTISAFVGCVIIIVFLFLLISSRRWAYGDMNFRQICHAIRNMFMQQMLPDDTEFTLNTDWCGVELPTHASRGAQSAENDFIFWNFLSVFLPNFKRRFAMQETYESRGTFLWSRSWWTGLISESKKVTDISIDI